MVKNRIIESLVEDISKAEGDVVSCIWELVWVPGKKNVTLGEFNEALKMYCILCSKLFVIDPVLYNLLINEKLSLYRVLWNVCDILLKIAKLRVELLTSAKFDFSGSGRL